MRWSHWIGRGIMKWRRKRNREIVFVCLLVWEERERENERWRVILQLVSWGLGLLWSHHRQSSNHMLMAALLLNVEKCRVHIRTPVLHNIVLAIIKWVVFTPQYHFVFNEIWKKVILSILNLISSNKQKSILNLMFLILF